MSTKNSNVPTAVGTNRTYAETIKENLQNGWEKIKTNPYVNMLFPVSDVAEGNTMAAVTAMIPMKQPVVTTAKTLTNGLAADLIVRELNGMGPAIGGDDFFKELAKRIEKYLPPKVKKIYAGNIYKKLKSGEGVIPTPDGQAIVRGKDVLSPTVGEEAVWMVKQNPHTTGWVTSPGDNMLYRASDNVIHTLPFKQGGTLNYFDYFK